MPFPKSDIQADPRNIQRDKSMADPVTALSLLFNVVTTVNTGISTYRIGKADLRFLLSLCKSYLSSFETALFKLVAAEGDVNCKSQAERVLIIHASVGEWLVANGFKNVGGTGKGTGGNIRIPRLWNRDKAKFFRGMVEVVVENSDRLRGLSGPLIVGCCQLFWV
jgi:hypothetical protein